MSHQLHLQYWDLTKVTKPRKGRGKEKEKESQKTLTPSLPQEGTGNGYIPGSVPGRGGKGAGDIAIE
jgi:hypothetical protein